MFTHFLPNVLTKIRNASLAKKREVEVSLSNLSISIVRTLHQAGSIRDFTVQKGRSHFFILVGLSQSDGNTAIRHLQLHSKPGLRIYTGWQQLRKFDRNPGFTIVTTTKGLMTSKTAGRLGLGGEVLCSVS